MLPECIRYSHTDPSLGMIIWGVKRYTSRSFLVHTNGISNSGHCVSVVLRSVTRPLIQALRNSTFMQDNGLHYTKANGYISLNVENIRFMPCPACSATLSQI